MSLVRQFADAPTDYLRRFVRWARKSDELRGTPIEQVGHEVIVEEALWQVDPYQDRGMY